MKYALVTGGTKGIGKAISLSLLAKGYFVFINYANDEEAAITLSEELKLKFIDHFEIINVSSI